ILLKFMENIVVIDEEFFHHIVRKGAHLSAYFILGILTMFVFEHRINSNTVQMAVAFLLGVLYAASDEVHQLFVPGSSVELREVGMGAVGALCGIIIEVLLQKMFRKT